MISLRFEAGDPLNEGFEELLNMLARVLVRQFP